MDILYVFLPFIILLGIVTSYEDIKLNIIRNKWIIYSLFIGLFFWVILYFLKRISLHYLILIIMYGLSALIIGFFVWFIGLWNAGDAKLYFAFSFLIPLSFYQQNYFPAFVLLMNSVIPLFLFLVGKLLIKSDMKQKLIVLKKILEPKLLGNIILTIFSLSWISQYLFVSFGIKYNYFFGILIIMGLKKLLDRIASMSFLNKLNVKSLHILMVICVLRIGFQYEFILTSGFLMGFIVLTLLYVIIRMFVLELGGIFSEKVPIMELKEGMVLDEVITKKGEKKKIGGFGYSQFGQKDSLLERYSAGLSKKDIKKIKSMYKKGKIKFDKINVQETMPFAPFIFLGVIITLFLGKDVVSLFQNIFL